MKMILRASLPRSHNINTVICCSCGNSEYRSSCFSRSYLMHHFGIDGIVPLLVVEIALIVFKNNEDDT